MLSTNTNTDDSFSISDEGHGTDHQSLVLIHYVRCRLSGGVAGSWKPGWKQGQKPKAKKKPEAGSRKPKAKTANN